MAGFDFPDDGRAMGLTDWDHDGDLDVWINNRNAPQLRYLRNTTETGKARWISVQLQGKSCNRDAIGARVTLHFGDKDARETSIRTVRAGDGYLSQSGKRLHFGLGNHGAIGKLTVAWPGGGLEEFPSPEVNRHYAITQGKGRLVPWKRPSPVTPPPVAGALAVSEDSTTETVLAYQLPAPGIPYQSLDRNAMSVVGSGNYQLVNLWATWCVPCLGELKDFRESHEALKAAGITVTALSVEALDDPDGLEKVKEFASRGKYPFAMGLVTVGTLKALETLHHEIFESRRQLPLPFSVLLGPEHRVVAVFKGPVAAARLIEIVRLEPDNQRMRLALATPYRGTWAAVPYRYQLGAYLRNCLKAGFSADVERILKDAPPASDPDLPHLYAELGQELERADRREEALVYFGRAVDLKPDNAPARLNLGIKLAAAGRFPEAEAALRKATSLDATLTQAWVQRGALQMKMRLKDDAIVSLDKALALEPGEPVAHASLGAIRRSEKDWEAARHHFQAAVAAKPNVSAFRFHLALTLEMAGEHAAAIGEYRDLLAREADHQGALNNLGWLLATSHDPKVIDAENALVQARALLLAGGKSWRALDTYAAALAASGDYGDAVESLSEAIALAESADVPQENKRALDQRLQLYRQGKPYRSPAPPGR